KGEFIVIVGPSGSGKSTLLDLICGFEDITSGNIKIENKIINEIPSKDRDVAMVFQNYAIFPHLSAYENIAFGMKIRKENKKTIDEKVKWASKILELDEYLNKKPSKLSGGQRQRIAIARAMVREPKLFLMDEPLSNLDSKLRYSTCNEITNLHNQINATTIYVTHDQSEALTMASRIIVLNNGEIQQIGKPYEVYNNPQNEFVAKFIGRPQINLFEIVLKEDELIMNDSFKINVKNVSLLIEKDKKYKLGVRAEQIYATDDEDGIKATIEKIEYMGGENILHLNSNNNKFTMKTYEENKYSIGEQIYISFKLEKTIIFDIDTKEIIGRVTNEKKN
ncbi:MAG: ABC transporter ATP-binding protein, partial [Peptostreptococcaceae bacterium]